MRVLHLIDGGFRISGACAFDEGSILACRLLVQRARHQQWVCILGPRPAVERAGRLGLRADAAIAPMLGLPEEAWQGLRRLVAARGQPDVVVCWGPRASRLALRAMGEAVPRVTILPDGEAATTEVAVVYGEAARQRLADCDIGRVVVVPPPAWEPDPREREWVRDELGVSPGEVLVALLGGPPQADAMRFTFLVSLLREAKVGVRGVMIDGAGHRMRAVAFARGIRKVGLSITSLPMMRVLGACDLGVFDGGGPGPTRNWDPAPWAAPPAITPAMAAGVPVVAPGWALAAGSAFPECVALNSTLPELARKLIELALNPDLRARIGHESRARFGWPGCGEPFVRAVSDVWEDAVAAANGAAHE